MTTTDRHEMLAELFADATSVPAAQRDEFLASRAISQTVRTDLHALLRFHETLHAPDLHGTVLHDWLLSTPGELPAGTRIGSFQIERLLGRGGSSAVYAARQTGALERDVALKILDLPEPITQAGRFAAERNAMAMLDHPGIAHIFDADVDAEGRAFIAMERVSGSPIDAWYAQHKPTVRQTVELIIRIAEAIEYAHSRGVIHRDIKPSNLLVAGAADSPSVKVIDFGLVAAAAGSTLRRWLGAQDRWAGGTPLFMPPEQAAPDAVPDVRADVYGLGAVLHALLAGKPPLDLSDLTLATPPELFSAVQTRLRASLRDAAPHIPRDLAAVCDKAISTNDRYENMSALIADLRRFLNCEPVTARRATPGYVAARFIRRNRAWVAGISLALLLLAAGAVGTFAGYLRARSENTHFRDALASKEAINHFLTDDLLGGSVVGQSGGEVGVVELVDTAAATLSSQFEGRPKIEADLRLTLGETYFRLLKYAAARDMLEKARPLIEKHTPADDPLRARALALLGMVYAQTGKLEEAEDFAKQSLAVSRESVATRYANALAHEVFSEVARRRRNYDRAIAEADRAIALLQAMFDDKQGSPIRLGEALWFRAELLQTAGRTEAAERAMAELPEQLIKLLGPENGYTIRLSANRAEKLMDANRYAEALPLLERLLPIFQKQSGPHHPDTLTMQSNLISALGNTGQPDRAVALCRALVPEVDIASGRRSAEAAHVRHRLAAMLLRSDKPADALAPADEAVQIAVATLGGKNWITGQFIATRGYCHEARNEFAEAKVDLLRAKEILAPALGTKHARVKTVEEHLTRIEIAKEAKPASFGQP